MNWKEISEKYPKAFLALADNLYSWRSSWKDNMEKSEHALDYLMDEDEYYKDQGWDYSLRDLYDFFDEQGIIIYLTFEGFHGKEAEFHIKIVLLSDTEDKEYPHGLFTGRKYAEAEAFLKAFEVLESKLK